MNVTLGFFRDAISKLRMEVDGDGSGVRRSARLSARKRHCSKFESNFACCFESRSPSPKLMKQEKTEGSKSKTSFRKSSKTKPSKTPRVLVGRLPASERKPVLQLVQMPALVLRRMMCFLDVASLENLAATCEFFHQLVTLRGVTTLNIPFSNKFIAELNAVKTFHKQKVYRLQSLKEDDTNVPDDEAIFVEYMISSQVSD